MPAIKEAHASRQVGWSWLLTQAERAQFPYERLRAKADSRVATLCAELWEMPPAHGDAILAAVRWYWGHADAINRNEDEWWRPEFRRASLSARRV